MGGRLEMIHCVRCDKEGEPIKTMPHGGSLGEMLKAKVCLSCWEEWNGESVKVINEHRLNLSEAAARGFLSTQMKVFLKLIPPPPTGPITISSSL